MSKIAGIYKLTNKVNGKVYIGQSVDLERRMRRYGRGDVVGLKKLEPAFKKYGIDAFKIEYLFTTSKKYRHLNYLLGTLELAFTKRYDSVNNGYNCKYGEVLGKMSEETKDRISKSMKGKVAGVNNGMYGKKHKKETIKKFRARKRTKEQIEATASAARGKPRPYDVRKKLSVAHSKPVIQYSKEGIFIREYKSIKDAAKAMGISTGSISMCCHERTKTGRGYVWKFKKEAL